MTHPSQEFLDSITDPTVRAAVMTSTLLGEAIAAAPRPAIYPFVSDYLSARPHQWIYAQEIVDASNGFFTISGVGSVMGSLHDEGKVVTIGIAGERSRRAKWDIA